jgi:ComF family protein
MLKSLLSLFLQPNCPLCQRSTSQGLICPFCQKQLDNCQLKNPHQFCGGNIPLFFWGEYGGKLKRAIAALKYEGHYELGELMGTWLGQRWKHSSLCSPGKSLNVIPIPLHRKKLQERGFIQAELIARGFCQVTGYKLLPQGLKRVRETKPMFGLNPAERAKNVERAIMLGKNLQERHPPSPILIVDDIYTTGTTVREAVQVLQGRGFVVFGVAAVAAPKSTGLTQKPVF